MNLPLLEEFHAAYESDLWPMRGAFLVGCFACPLTALAIRRGVVDRNDSRLELNDEENPVFLWACDEFGAVWVHGFMNGFDDEDRAESDSDYSAGYELGSLALEQLLPRDERFST